MTPPSVKTHSPTYTIGTGWWCSTVAEAIVNPHRKLLGSPSVRSVDFFETWLKSVWSVSSPSSIVVVDSASPTKPSAALREQTAWVELPFNARHSVDHVGRWSGWTRSVLVSGQYALATDCEHYVYVEQDCLLSGAGLIEHCIQAGRKGIMFGSGRGTPQPIQQSFFIIRQDKLAAFLKNLATIKAADQDFSPEWKFVCATWRPLVILANLGVLKPKLMRRLAAMVTRIFFFDILPIGSGRGRPVQTDAEFYYFQHGSEDEVSAFLEGAQVRESSGPAL